MKQRLDLITALKEEAIELLSPLTDKYLVVITKEKIKHPKEKHC